MIVVDTNLLIYFLVPGPWTQKAERVRSKEKAWVAPSLIAHETLNVLAKYGARGSLNRDSAARIHRRGMALVGVSDIRSDPLDILTMAEQSGCSTYDLEFVWLAKERGLPLITADKQVLNAFPDVAVALDYFSTT